MSDGEVGDPARSSAPSARAARLKVDIEELVRWALVEQGLGWDSGGAASSGGGMAMMMALGTMVSSSGVVASPSMALFSDDDALVVAAAIKALHPEMAALVFTYGRAGTRPDWAPEGYGQPQPLRNKKGQVRVDYYRDPAGKRDPVPMLDHLAHSERKLSVDFFRAGYSLWWRGLELLVPVINAQTRGREATGPAAPMAPWQAGEMRREDLPAAAAARMRAYEEGTGSLIGQLSVEELRQSAQAEVRARPDQWGAGDSGVTLGEAEDGRRDAALAALRGEGS